MLTAEQIEGIETWCGGTRIRANGRRLPIREQKAQEHLEALLRDREEIVEENAELRKRVRELERELKYGHKFNARGAGPG